MRIIGIDLGEKRIGIAVTDKSNKISYPLTVIENNSNIKERILKIINEYNIGKIVIGMPYNLKGEAGHQAKIASDFVDRNLKDFNLPIVCVDERFTSKIAINTLKGTERIKKKSGKKKSFSFKPGDTDKLSASLLLNEYLESLERTENKTDYIKKKNKKSIKK
ncbi:MAG: Holliday junction resolvase RuvX [Actinobacteria bacterium]|nr:Holliday junction resolvase RuvX [Actinomycetota bacterium]MBM3712955.1 Holliday junction resolvase RuvX [Actinomycetota bacterium]